MAKCQPAAAHVAQQTRAERGSDPAPGRGLIQIGHAGQQRLIGGFGQDRCRLQDCPSFRGKSAGTLEDGVAQRRRYVQLVEGSTCPGTVLADDVVAVPEHPDRLLDRERKSVGAFVQEDRELFRDRVGLQHRPHQPTGVGNVQLYEPIQRGRHQAAPCTGTR